MSLLLQIVLSFMKISSVAFGGAYATIPLVEQEVVVSRGWMTYAEFSDLLAIDEITPGPILVNAATFVGMRVAGLPGAIAATLGCIIIPCAFAMALLFLYRRYRDSKVMDSALTSLKCMAVALIASTFLKLGANALMPQGAAPGFASGIYAACVMAAAFYLIHRKRLSPLPVMLGCGVVNLLVSGLIP